MADESKTNDREPRGGASKNRFLVPIIVAFAALLGAIVLLHRCGGNRVPPAHVTSSPPARPAPEKRPEPKAQPRSRASAPVAPHIERREKCIARLEELARILDSDPYWKTHRFSRSDIKASVSSGERIVSVVRETKQLGETCETRLFMEIASWRVAPRYRVTHIPASADSGGRTTPTVSIVARDDISSEGAKKLRLHVTVPVDMADSEIGYRARSLAWGESEADPDLDAIVVFVWLERQGTPGEAPAYAKLQWAPSLGVGRVDWAGARDSRSHEGNGTAFEVLGTRPRTPTPPSTATPTPPVAPTPPPTPPSASALAEYNAACLASYRAGLRCGEGGTMDEICPPEARAQYLTHGEPCLRAQAEFFRCTAEAPCDDMTRCAPTLGRANAACGISFGR